VQKGKNRRSIVARCRARFNATPAQARAT